MLSVAVDTVQRYWSWAMPSAAAHVTGTGSKSQIVGADDPTHPAPSSVGFAARIISIRMAFET